MLLTIVHSSNFNAYLSRAYRVAIFPRLHLHHDGCLWFTPIVASDQCACGNDTETAHVKLISYHHNQDDIGNQHAFAVSIVNTVAKVVDALTKYEKCKCGANSREYHYSVYRPINENFYIQYYKYPASTDFVAVLAAKYESTKTQIEKTIQSVDDLKTRAYFLLCDYN